MDKAIRELVVVGAGGFGREVAWIVERINAVAPTFELLGFCDDAPDKHSGAWAGYPLLGAFASLGASRGRVGFFCAIGNNRVRQEVFAQGQALGFEPLTLIDPQAVVAPGVEIGKGSLVGIGSVVSVGCEIGAGVLINHHVCVGHDVVLQDFSQLCPGVCVSGGCHIGEGALLGTLAATIPLKQAGAWSTIGAGAVMLRDVAAGGGVVRIGKP